MVGPDCFMCPSAELDFRVGVTSVVCMRAPKEFDGQNMYSAWTSDEHADGGDI